MTDAVRDPVEATPAQAVPYAAGILYLAGGRVLLLMRGPGAADHPNTWSFPAGHIDPGESPLLAALRESMEEVGFAPAAAEPLLTDGGFVLFMARDSFVPVLCDESSGYVWAPVDALPAPLHPGVAEAIALAVAQSMPAGEEAMDERIVDTNGWPQIKDNPISKAGIFTYPGTKLGDKCPDPSRTYRVLRPPEELSTPEAIESFKLIPWIDNHVMLGPEEKGMTRPERKGIQGVIGEDVYFSAEDETLYGNLKLFSSAMADSIDAGKRELSCGYRCKYDWTPGVWNGQAYDLVQRNIRGNHLALVKSGRMGPDVAVLDHSDTDHFTFTCDSNFETQHMADQSSTTPAEGGSSGGESLEATREVFAGLVAKMDDILKDMAALKAKFGEPAATEGDKPADGEGKASDSASGEAKTEEAPAAAAKKDAGEEKKETAMDEATLMRNVSVRLEARNKLAAQLAKHVGSFDASAMDESDVAAYGCQKLNLKVPKGHESTALAVYFTQTKAPSERKTTTVAAMDSVEGGGWLATQTAALNG